MTGSSTEGIKIVLHPVSDLASAKAVYTALLGIPPQADSSYYAGLDAPRPPRRSSPRPRGRLVLLRRLRGRGPAHRAGAGRWTAGHDLTGGLLAGAGHRGEAGRGDRRGCHREGARARRRWRPPGGHRHRPRWQCPRAASGDTMSIATRTDTQSPVLHVADSHDLIRVHGARVNNLKDVSIEIPKRRLTVFTGVSGSGKSSLVFDTDRKSTRL